MPLTMFVVRDVAHRMRHPCAVDKVEGFMAGRGCFPKAWELTGGGGGLCAVDQRRVDGLGAQVQPGAGMHMDVDEDPVVAITEGFRSAPLVVAPLQLPSSMMLWARVS